MCAAHLVSQPQLCRSEGTLDACITGRLVSLGNLPSPSQSIFHLQFWALQLLPYVGCLCLRDPSHINVTNRASIYTDFLLSRTSSSAGVVHFIFPALLVHGYCSILCLGTNWETEGMGQKHGGDRKVQTPTGKRASGSGSQQRISYLLGCDSRAVWSPVKLRQNHLF